MLNVTALAASPMSPEGYLGWTLLKNSALLPMPSSAWTAMRLKGPYRRACQALLRCASIRRRTHYCWLGTDSAYMVAFEWAEMEAVRVLEDEARLAGVWGCAGRTLLCLRAGGFRSWRRPGTARTKAVSTCSSRRPASHARCGAPSRPHRVLRPRRTRISPARQPRTIGERKASTGLPLP
jgi:hypothetical protein